MNAMRMNIIALAAGLFFLSGMGVFAQNVGTIRDLSGTVELKHSGASGYVAAQLGDTVREDTFISTGFKSTAMIEVGSALIVVRPLTRLNLTDIQATADSETINVNLQSGRLRVDLNPPAGTKASMTVSSPSATASVRGTSFDIDTRNLRVHRGSVGFSGRKGQVILVSAGSNSKVASSGKAANPVDNKRAGLLPQAPVGTDTAPGTVTVVRPGTVDVEVIYK